MKDNDRRYDVRYRPTRNTHPRSRGYGAVWVYFQKQQAQIVRLLEARLSDKDKQIEQLLTERNIFQGLAWDAVQGTKLSTENTHRALSLTEKLQAAQGTN